MIQEFVDKFIDNKDVLKERFKINPPSNYDDIVKAMVETISGHKHLLDSSRITKIDYGGHQGTLIFVIGDCNYQPLKHYVTSVEYGSCTGCDTFYSIEQNKNEELRVDGYYTLALHLAQKLKEI